MAITFVNNSATISTTEYSLPANSTTLTAQTDDCILQVVLDLNALTATEQYEFKLYEKVNGGTARVCVYAVFSGAQPQPIYAAPSLIVGEGWDVTLKKLAGTDRAIPWSLRKVA